ncbi:MAG: YjbQ family protein [Candidatus Diapherotrites archaeon]|uniref:YjbQ family protein n=1 Tax=Candidatus Iainarchaeum sp. TaxID=3101447 RepID=A0A939C4T2_9ARCH|nr:YjbQ family protein [Candidatus Diapherotrites archaeon]
MFEEIPIKSKKRNELIDITGEVQKAVEKAKLKEGLCVVYSPHTTAAVVVTEGADPSVQTDLINALNRLVPVAGPYTHREGNSDAHIKSAIIGNSRLIFIKNSKLLLGTWESCYFVEADGPRQRKIFVKIIEG